MLIVQLKSNSNLLDFAIIYRTLLVHWVL